MATKPNGTTATDPTTNPPVNKQTYNPKSQMYNPKRIPKYRPSRRHNRRRCNCRRCFCQCCFWTILVIFVILVLAAIAGAIFYFLYRPQLPSFSISSLKISQFNLTTSPDDTTKLTTRFNVTLSTKNRNKKLVYTYDPISLTAESITNQIELANGVFPRFISAPNNVTIIHSTLSIVSQVLDVDSVSSLKSDMKSKSGLPVRILLDTKVVVQMDKLKSNKVGIRVTCDGINGPIPKGKNPTVASIANAKCKVDLRIKILRWTF
ncbi:hypothetical protein HAX54_043232 [Datura stramonium]|uniref:Late embryogenesis abundant protein LEA-2 subgroup domain-containing protein n=1 Tax=Datura stramonium TaxID=4076 RepID=A0ABS8SN89_DATST|nr:hypothetical protein [Datura stramonium]